MRLDELPRSQRVEHRRRMTPGRAGGVGIGTVVVLSLIGWALGIDPRMLIGGAEQMSGGGQAEQQQGPAGAPSDETGQFISAGLGSTEEVWTGSLAQHGETYRPPTLVHSRAAGLRKPQWVRST